MSKIVPIEIILLKLSETEKALASLYSLYAEKFPQKKEFWQTLVIEEIRFFDVLKSIASGHTAGIRIREGSVDGSLLQILLTYISEKKKELIESEVSYQEALETALNIGASMIAQEYYKIFEGDSHEFWETLDKFISETKEHTDRIRNEFGKKSRSLFD